jgi:hypothetical protein
MSSLAQRLRRAASLGLIDGGLMEEAAEEIERLRDEITRLRAALFASIYTQEHDRHR